MDGIEEILLDIKRRIEKLEEHSHPAIGLEDFDGFKKLEERIKKLEDGIQ